MANKKHNVDSNKDSDEKMPEKPDKNGGVINKAFEADSKSETQNPKRIENMINSCQMTTDGVDQAAEVDIGITKSMHCTSKL